MGHTEKDNGYSYFFTNEVGNRPYMHETWFLYLPFWIYIIAAIIVLIILIFNDPTAGGIIGYIVFAVIWGLIIWWLCDLGQLGWAWFFLLFPLILVIFVAAVAAGVATGNTASNIARQPIIDYLRARFAWNWLTRMN
jgi:hypothetical protein